MASNTSEALNHDLAEARKAARIGVALGKLRGDIALSDLLFEEGAAPGHSHAEWVALQADAAAKSDELTEASRRIGTDGELIPPPESLFAIWSPVHRLIELSQKIDGQWRTVPAMSLHIDSTVYDGSRFIIDPNAPERYQAPIANAIKIEPSDSQDPGGIYAYSPSGAARYKINDIGYEVDIVPDLIPPNNMYVRQDGDPRLIQALIE